MTWRLCKSTRGPSNPVVVVITGHSIFLYGAHFQHKSAGVGRSRLKNSSVFTATSFYCHFRHIQRYYLISPFGSYFRLNLQFLWVPFQILNCPNHVDANHQLLDLSPGYSVRRRHTSCFSLNSSVLVNSRDEILVMEDVGSKG